MIFQHAIVKIALDFTSCNYLTVTDIIILELHSNMCDYTIAGTFVMFVLFPIIAFILNSQVLLLWTVMYCQVKEEMKDYTTYLHSLS